MAEATEQSIVVECSCGKKLKAPASAVGRKARCKACGTILIIGADSAGAAAGAGPAPAARRSASTRPAAQKPKDELADDDDPLGALYALAKEEKNADRIVDEPRCPQCMSPLTQTAVICTSCGYNVKTGKAMKTVTDTPKAAKKPLFGMGNPKPATTPSGKQVQDAMAPQGSFMLGLLGCGLGGLVGGVIWFLIAWFSGYELGFIALLVGALAGLGMQIGQKGYSSLGGGVAAAVALLAILLAKAAVVVAVVIPILEAEDNLSDGDYDERVVDMMIDQEYAARNLDPEETTFEEDEQVWKAVDQKLSAMSDAEMKAAVTRAEDHALVTDLTEYMTWEVLEGMKIDPDDVNEAQYAMAEQRASQKVAEMTVDQRRAELKRLEAKAEAEFEAAIAAAEAEDDGEMSDEEEGSGVGGAVALAGMGLFMYILLGGWKSILFLFLAVSIAYKTASGGVSG